MPSVQFVRLTTALAVMSLGVILEQMSDQAAKNFIFLMIFLLCTMKLFFEIETFFNVELRQYYFEQKTNKLYQGILLAIHKILYIIQIVVLSKWFSRNWFPFFFSLWIMSQHLAKFMQDYAKCNYFDYVITGKFYGKMTYEQCLEDQSWYGILTCAFTFILAVIMLKYYSMDPVDVNLIINEQATYLSTNLKDVRKIMSVSSFLDEVEEAFEKEQDLRRGTIKTLKESSGPSDS